MFLKQGLLNRKFALPLYSCIILLYIYSLSVAAKLHITHDNPSEYLIDVLKFRRCFFTLWNFMTQIIFLFIVIIDEIGFICKWSTNLQKKINAIRCFMYHAFILPFGIFVWAFFWTIFIYDRELIFPKELDLFFPLWLNHVVHSVIILPIIIEILLPKQRNFLRFKHTLTGLLIYLTIYQIIFITIYLRYGVWLYVIFYKVSWLGVGFIGILQYIGTISLLKFGLFVQNMKRNNKIKL